MDGAKRIGPFCLQFFSLLSVLEGLSARLSWQADLGDSSVGPDKRITSLYPNIEQFETTVMSQQINLRELQAGGSGTMLC